MIILFDVIEIVLKKNKFFQKNLSDNMKFLTYRILFNITKFKFSSN